MRAKSAKFWWIIGSIGLVMIILVGAAVAYSVYFSNHAAPGVSIAGESITGQTREEASTQLQSRIDAVSVDLSVDGVAHPATLGDLGFQVDVAATVDEAFAVSSSPAQQFGALFSASDITPQVSQDASATDTFMTELIELTGQTMSNAAVELSEGKDAFVVIPAVAGHTTNSAAVTETGLQAATTLTSATLDVDMTDVEPTITTEEATAVATKANAMVTATITLNGGPDETFSPSAVDKASWITIDESADKLTAPIINKTAVAAWVETVAGQTNEAPKEGTRNVNSRGDVVSVVDGGTSGWKVNNAEAIVAGVMGSIESGAPYVAELTYDEAPTDKWIDNVIPDGAADNIYQASPGEKWIDIDLSNYTVSAYEGGTIVNGPVLMVPGAPLTPTVTGTFRTYMKLPSQTMRGNNVDGTKYVTENVPSVQYFYQDYALHGAYWRSSFGYGGAGGSHGCVNMPLDSADWFYDWAPVGTVVVSHY